MTQPASTDNYESRYEPVDVIERVRVLTLHDHVDELDEFTYSWRHGYETLTAKRHGGGGFEYRGMYHPGDGCCVGNPCHYCGKVWHDEP
jgi:hypothetical protein